MTLDLWFIHLEDIGTLASWIAAVISATATGITLWLRRRDRPEADFLLEQAGIQLGPRGRQLVWQSYRPDRDFDDCLSVINVGDGTAYGVTVTSNAARVRPLIPDSSDKRGFATPVIVPRLPPGEDFMLVVWTDEGASRDDVAFRIEWTAAPTRHKRKRSMIIARSSVLTEYPGESRYGK